VLGIVTFEGMLGSWWMRPNFEEEFETNVKYHELLVSDFLASFDSNRDSTNAEDVDVRLVFFAREQQHWLRSWIGQRSRKKVYPGSSAMIERSLESPLLNWSRVVERLSRHSFWETCVVPFPPQNGLINAFSAACGLPPAAEPVYRLNESLGGYAFAKLWEDHQLDGRVTQRVFRLREDARRGKVSILPPFPKESIGLGEAAARRSELAEGFCRLSSRSRDLGEKEFEQAFAEMATNIQNAPDDCLFPEALPENQVKYLREILDHQPIGTREYFHAFLGTLIRAFVFKSKKRVISLYAKIKNEHPVGTWFRS